MDYSFPKNLVPIFSTKPLQHPTSFKRPSAYKLGWASNKILLSAYSVTFTTQKSLHNSILQLWCSYFSIFANGLFIYYVSIWLDGLVEKLVTSKKIMLTKCMGRLEELQNYAYVIYEWSLNLKAKWIDTIIWRHYVAGTNTWSKVLYISVASLARTLMRHSFGFCSSLYIGPFTAACWT